MAYKTVLYVGAGILFLIGLISCIVIVPLDTVQNRLVNAKKCRIINYNVLIFL